MGALSVSEPILIVGSTTALALIQTSTPSSTPWYTVLYIFADASGLLPLLDPDPAPSASRHHPPPCTLDLALILPFLFFSIVPSSTREPTLPRSWVPRITLTVRMIAGTWPFRSPMLLFITLITMPSSPSTSQLFEWGGIFTRAPAVCSGKRNTSLWFLACNGVTKFGSMDFCM